MLEAVTEAVRSAPERLRQAPERLKDAPERLRTRGEQVRTELQGRAKRLESEGRERLWRGQIKTLERAEELLEKAEELPVISSVADNAERLVHSRLELVTAIPVEGYEDLNAKSAIAAVKELDRVGVLCVQRWELANKNRKTVLAAVDHRLEELDAE